MTIPDLKHAMVTGLLGCAVIFGPERFPLDGGMHTEIRVQVCEAAVIVESRTYERVQNKDVTYTVTMLSSGEDGWQEVGRAMLDITVRAKP